MSLPHRVSQWWLYVLEAARHRAAPPYLMAALLDRETEGGTSPYLDQPGPGGTGDFAPREGAHYARSQRYKATVFTRKKDGVRTVGYLPADGRGWGRGLFQLDYEWHPEWMGRWMEPAYNSDCAAQLVAHAFVTFPGDELAVVASYNAGAKAVRDALAALTRPISRATELAALDPITKGGNYVSDVLRRRDAFLPGPDAQT